MADDESAGSPPASDAPTAESSPPSDAPTAESSASDTETTASAPTSGTDSEESDASSDVSGTDPDASGTDPEPPGTGTDGTPESGTTTAGPEAPKAGDDRPTEPGTPDAHVAAYTTGERTISARVQFQWALRLLIGVAVLTVIVRTGLAGVGATVDPRLVPGLAGTLGLLGLVWVHLRYRAWSYHLRADALSLERGVFTKVTTIAPHVRIQHVDTSRSPLERALGLSTLVVYTAGSRGADVSIPGLTPGEASDLQRRLKELAIETEGGDAL